MTLFASRQTRLVAFALLAVGISLAAIGLTLSTPTSTAQVGVPYSSSCAASGGNPPYTYIISVGQLPNGLNFGSTSGVIAGTPTVAGTFNFTCQATDTPPPTVVGNGPAEANRRVIAKSGTPLATAATAFSITVSPAPSPTPVPPSIWMAAMGLAGAGLFRMRQIRRA